MQFSRRNLLKGVTAAAVAAPVLHVDKVALRPRLPADRFNVIEIVIDSLSTHWIGAYGAHTNPSPQTPIQTPHIDALAARSVMFLDAYPDGLPTVLVRRALYTGRQIFPSYMVPMTEGGLPWRGWHPLYREDNTQAEAFFIAEYTTQLISDCYHQFEPAFNFQFGFKCFNWIRGQETDRWATGPQGDSDISGWVHPSTPNLHNVRTYLRNRHAWKTEEDWPTHRLFAAAGDWLDTNVDHNQPFYLHIECYSPHEMWDPPDDYYRLYMTSGYHGPRLIFPPQNTRNMTSVELKHVRALYGGMVTFVDSRIGMFLNKVEQLGLMNNTMIVLTADHGTFMGEQGDLHKDQGVLRTQLLHIPLLIYHPDYAGLGLKIGGFVKHTDVMPTLLDLNNISIPKRVTGQSLRPLIERGTDSTTDAIYGGWDNHGFIRTREWSYIGRWNPGEEYQDLYDVAKDPQELYNLNGKRDSVTRDFKSKLLAYVAAGWDTTRGTFLQANPQ